MGYRSASQLAPPLVPAVATVALLLAMVVGLVLLIDADLLRPFDAGLIARIRAEPLVAPLGWLRAATELGATGTVALLALAVGAVELRAGRPFLAGAAAATIGLAALANTTFKLVVGRPRPDELPPIVVEPGYAFPSGHSLSAMVAYGVIAVLVARSSLGAGLRAALVIGLGVVVLAVGVSRIYLGAHYPSDVLGGWLTGLAWVVLFAAVSARLDPGLSGPRAREPGATAARADRAGPRSGPPGPG